MFKFLHTADIHLDSPLLNLDKYDDAPREEFRSATRRAFDNIVDLAMRETVDLVIIAGDLDDGDCTDFHTPRYIRRQMQRLESHRIRVFIIQGNHDAANNMKKAFRLEMPDNVKLFSTSKPETERLEEIGVAIHGQGFSKREVTEDLSQSYPDALPNYINIGILHSSCGVHDQHDTYAPSTVKGLSSKGYDYWALGHIHKHQTLSGPNPWIVYSGNPQGRSVRETGARGCVIATYDGERILTKRHETDVMRWIHVTVDVSDCSDALSIQPMIHSQLSTELSKAGDRPLAARIELVGETGSHSELVRQADYWDAQIRESVLDQFDEQVWIEKIKFQTRPPRVALRESDSALGELIAGIERPEIAAAAFEELRSDFEKMLSTIPTDPRLAREEIDITRDEVCETMKSDARDLLLTRLLNSGGDA
ncbi:MAG: DNA repair exonuclease [Planctomycetales bacterium]|nr:DNA repair exonuclease [Planctomycetales bacterium]